MSPHAREQNKKNKIKEKKRRLSPSDNCEVKEIKREEDDVCAARRVKRKEGFFFFTLLYIQKIHGLTDGERAALQKQKEEEEKKKKKKKRKRKLQVEFLSPCIFSFNLFFLCFKLNVEHFICEIYFHTHEKLKLSTKVKDKPLSLISIIFSYMFVQF
jgi:hypothetical protein